MKPFLKWSSNRLIYLMIFAIAAGIMAGVLLIVMDSLMNPAFGIRNIHLLFCLGVYLCVVVGLFFVFLKKLHDKEKNKSAKSNKGYLKEKF